MFIYRTELFEEQVREQSNLYGQINRLCDELAQMSLDQVQSRFERIYPFLKRKEGNLRLVARIYRVDKTPILCWLTLFPRGDRAYEDFLRDREHYAHQSWAGEVEESRLREWLRQQKTLPTHTTPRPLPTHLYRWLTRPNWGIDTNRLLIYESQTWVEQFSTSAIHQHWKHYNQLIIDLVDRASPPGWSYPQWGVILYGEEGHFLLYAHLITQDELPREILFLICPFVTLPSSTEIERLVNSIQVDFTQPLFLDELTNWAQRAYPSELIVAEQSWLAIEEEATTNLALSAEEEGILHSVSTSSPSLPLFLNGQAGSGKSTLLFHLFADYCHRHFLLCDEQENETSGTPHPLFLAYNERLLEVAKEQVAILLAYHHRFTEEQAIANPSAKIAPFFQTFREFLRHLLPPQEREQFSPEKYISFHRFRQLCRRHLPKYSPEQCWLVIRTFIKGYHLDERDYYLTIEDYQEIPHKEKVVSEDVFAEIYYQVWHWYEKHTQETGEWDDQDLIRWVLRYQYYSPDYTAIFCDEAQDFTRLELQLIMRLSVFSQYDLEHEYISSLPFAFAGDPLQTLNPTGFRWASLKATFYNEVLTVLSPTGNLNLEMNFQELVCNYRSFPAIVGVSNLIQLWRKSLFHWQDIEPQTARKFGDRAPQKFILGQNLTSEEAKRYLPSSLIILPCDETGELDYVRNDQLLRDLFPEGKTGNQPWNMLSAIAAKGLEFKQVILYKFGDHCPQNFFQSKNHSSAKIKYFLNKLYVAVSRATEQLLVVDTLRGEEKLWQYATHESTIQKLIKSTMTDTEKWQNKVNPIRWGDSPENLGKDDPKAIAKTFMEEGLNSQNPDLLRRAQQAYQRLEEKEKAAFCEAEALKLEGKLIAAGNCFFKQQNLEAAWKCFWQGMGWEELVVLSENIKNTTGEMREKIKHDAPLIQYMAQAKTVSQTPNLEQLEQFTQFLASCLKDEQFAKEGLSRQWQTALKTYAQQITQLLRKSTTQSTPSWQNYAHVLETIGQQASQKQLLQLAGECYFQSKNYQQAITCWEASNSNHQAQYYRAKAYLLGMPDGLEYLVRLGANQEIVQEWEKANQPFKKEWLTYVAPVLEANQNYSLALRAYCHLNQKEKVETCWQKLPSPPSAKLAALLISFYIHFQYWEEMTVAWENYFPFLVKEAPARYYRLLIAQLANSKLTPKSLRNQQRQRLEKTFQNDLLNHPIPTDNFPVSHLGVSLERIGSLLSCLKFYEHYVNDETQPALQKFARERWLATKKKQALYFQKQGRKAKAQSIEKQLYQQASEWNLTPHTISLDPPQLSLKNLSFSPSQPSLKLPPQTKVRSSSPEILQLQIRHLDIKIMKKTKQILVTDRLSQKTLRIDGVTGQIKIGEMVLKALGEEGLSFVFPSGSFGGKVTYRDRACQIELRIPGIGEKLAITLS
jgi:hypothetical protein